MNLFAAPSFLKFIGYNLSEETGA
ncbi:hypothetical protein CBM2605_A90047 [Cupriavidus neocaledonicus]|uniref:Uncharacterized protein n=1 Tax=Cupriavidus neocaledonicus TaxID=1040979 RepID=A0ABY1V4V1_9BURK|nr:hypothetical protein CBM2605_A90047 [Cupriavidus neocaledonicus]